MSTMITVTRTAIIVIPTAAAAAMTVVRLFLVLVALSPMMSPVVVGSLLTAAVVV